MNENGNIQEFLKRAKEIGTPEPTLVGMLRARGWPEKQVYEALANHYEQQVGMPIPHRTGSGTAAKDAFFYLLIFSTLATWTIALGALAFTLIDRWFADTLFSNAYVHGYDVYSAACSEIAGAFDQSTEHEKRLPWNRSFTPCCRSSPLRTSISNVAKRKTMLFQIGIEAANPSRS